MSQSRCPVCSHPGFVLEEDKELSYRRCFHCGVIWSPERLEAAQRFAIQGYDKGYFGEEYRAQYGRSYEEDEAHIRRLAQNRLARLRDLAPELAKDISLCDVGCALGFFLSEAQSFGFDPVCGLEISSHAAAYVRGRFSFAVHETDFLAWQPPAGQQFDVLSFFYVLEHFARPQEAWKRIASLVKPGGWLLLALPSTFGPLYCWQHREWLSSHPRDHFVDYDPLSIRLVLKYYGFVLKGLYATPPKWERLPALGQGLMASRTVFAGFRGLSSGMGFGDTMEIYARRVF